MEKAKGTTKALPGMPGGTALKGKGDPKELSTRINKRTGSELATRWGASVHQRGSNLSRQKTPDGWLTPRSALCKIFPHRIAVNRVGVEKGCRPRCYYNPMVFNSGEESSPIFTTRFFPLTIPWCIRGLLPSHPATTFLPLRYHMFQALRAGASVDQVRGGRACDYPPPPRGGDAFPRGAQSVQPLSTVAGSPAAGADHAERVIRGSEGIIRGDDPESGLTCPARQKL